MRYDSITGVALVSRTSQREATCYNQQSAGATVAKIILGKRAQNYAQKMSTRMLTDSRKRMQKRQKSMLISDSLKTNSSLPDRRKREDPRTQLLLSADNSSTPTATRRASTKRCRRPRSPRRHHRCRRRRGTSRRSSPRCRGGSARC